MTDTLGAFIERRRTQLGMNQTQLGERAGVPRQTVNRLEQGVTKLPGALIRRQLAAALGVTHLELLIAAGELSEDEVSMPEDSRSTAVKELTPIIDSIDWEQNPRLLTVAKAQLAALRDFE